MSPASGDYSKDGLGYKIYKVSIQLMSPASGDSQRVTNTEIEIIASVSIQLMSPASGDINNATPAIRRNYYVSIQLMSPASGDFYSTSYDAMGRDLKVSIQLMSPASGDLVSLLWQAIKVAFWFPFN